MRKPRLTHLPRLHFLHIPKTAGTSVRLWLEELCDVDACCPYLHAYELAAEAPKLEDYAFFSGHLHWDFIESHAASLRFETLTFLRDPGQRLISELRYVKTFSSEQLGEYRDRTWVTGWVGDLIGNNPIKAALDSPRFALEAADMQTRFLSLTRRQGFNRALRKPDFDLALDRLEGLAAFGLVEEMERSELLIADAFGLPSRTMTGRENVASGKLPSASSEEMEAAREVNAYDNELYRRARGIFAARWSSLLALYGLSDEPEGVATLARRFEEGFRLTDRGLPRLGAFSADPSQGMVIDGWGRRFLYAPVNRWIRWSQTARPRLWLPIDRGVARRLSVQVPYVSAIAVRDGLSIEVDGEAVASDRAYEVWPEDGNHHLVISAPIPPAPAQPQYTEIAFRLPADESQSTRFAISTVTVSDGV